MSLDKFADMLKFGINLKLSGNDENLYYAQRLRFYIMEMEEFDCESENDQDLDVYYKNQCVLKVKINDGSDNVELFQINISSNAITSNMSVTGTISETDPNALPLAIALG